MEEDVKQESMSQDEVSRVEKPGEKTDPALLLKSLQEEREKRRLEEEKRKELEETLANYTNASAADEVFSDEGKALQSEISQLKEKIELTEIVDKYPELKGLSSEFTEFRKGYPGVDTEKIAKLFISENGLSEKPRKGLEKETGGGRTPPPSDSLNAEEVAKLRTTNFRKYLKLLQEGKIKVD